MMRKVLVAIVLVSPLAVLVLNDYGLFIRAHVPGGLPRRPVGAPDSRPARPWATPLREPALENFYRVTDDLYRGAQPDAAGLRRLKALGVKTVVNLRRFHEDGQMVGQAGLEWVHINVNPFKPRRDQLVAFLRVASDPNRTPVFVHCQRGIDRTGMMCAVYRMVICGWTKAEAIDEMTNGPFGYDATFKNVVEFLWRLDVEDLRREVEAKDRGEGSERAGNGSGQGIGEDKK
jgi:protein tyrosine phosphatase (PTP) superfamily phosphohydrolase (DUF442 family)